MKAILTLFIFSATAFVANAQLVLQPGSNLYVEGNTQITLHNTNLVVNGTLDAGIGTIRFTGSNMSTIGGTQPINFYNLEMNKDVNISVELENTINLANQLVFTTGNLDIKTYHIYMAANALLINENENSRVTGGSGFLFFAASLNAPNAANPGNLGAIITSPQNLGNVAIRRGHLSQQNGNSTGSSILRFYDIIPANNAGLNATLRFQYFDGELNGLTEGSLVFWKSENTISWSRIGFNSRNTSLNYVEKTGINSFSRWTLSDPLSPLPIRLVSFTVKCDNDAVLLNWKTAQELNSHHFNIEKSTDGSNWTVIGNLPAAGYSSTERTYTFTDNAPVQNGLYRIAQYDINGAVFYSGINRSSCSTKDKLEIWPNPFRENVYVRINTTNASQATIQIFDSKGSLVKTKQAAIVAGSNQITINAADLAKGIYLVTAMWNDGAMKETIRIVKQ